MDATTARRWRVGGGDDADGHGGPGRGYHTRRQTSTADGIGCSGGSAATTHGRATGSSATVAGQGGASSGILPVCSGDSEASNGATVGAAGCVARAPEDMATVWWCTSCIIRSGMTATTVDTSPALGREERRLS